MNDNLRQRVILRCICTVGRIAGLTLIILSAVGLTILLWNLSGMLGSGVRIVLREFTVAISDYFLTGLVILGVVQFIRYTVEDEYEPGWILRRGHIILAFFALFILLGWLADDLPRLLKGYQTLRHTQSLWGMSVRIVGWSAISLPVLTKVASVLGLAVTLRAVLPIMAESKTLV